MKRCAILCILGVFLGAACTPPKGWKGYTYSASQYGRTGSARTIRVKIYSGKAVAIKSRARYVFRGRGTASVNGQGKFIPRGEGEYTTNDGIFRIGSKIYSGRLRIYNRGKGFIYVNVLGMGEYLVSVVGHEMSSSWEIEALKAQSVVARTYALQRMKEANKRPYDVDATTAHQVYGGRLRKEESLRRAVQETRDQVLTYRGDLAQVFFYSSCGGRTAASDEVWRSAHPYLVSKRSSYCKGSPAYKWQTKIGAGQLAKLLGRGAVTSMSVTRRTPSHRVKSLQVQTRGGSLVISGDELRRKLGAKRIKSTLFGVRRLGSTFHIAGRGFGHGVGMCQWGAKTMARKRDNYRSILRHYFPGTAVTGLRRSLLSQTPAGSERERKQG